MMTRETDTLADVVMNALWYSDRYMPTTGQTEDELNPGKLAREYVVFPLYLPPRFLPPPSLSLFQ